MTQNREKRDNKTPTDCQEKEDWGKMKSMKQQYIDRYISIIIMFYN